ncbi:hypothetical protein B4U79_13087 [Dinothrombium tinctorium]|uniref:Chitin-binding type-2 domain-containing protein n=1 Tax=Dinothrombium tinctorium TaxID=1965070 RepID=A0A3S3PFH7_9ACAR|nr:hypothetical protein B4U79_13087 [Dinothrombium tinctorium]
MWTVFTIAVLSVVLQLTNAQDYDATGDQPQQDVKVFVDVHNHPKTGFSCADKKTGEYYADPETNCAVYYICLANQYGKLSPISFACPNGTIFNQANRVCTPYEQVSCNLATRYYNSFRGHIDSENRDPSELAPASDPASRPWTSNIRPPQPRNQLPPQPSQPIQPSRNNQPQLPRGPSLPSRNTPIEPPRNIPLRATSQPLPPVLPLQPRVTQSLPTLPTARPALIPSRRPIRIFGTSPTISTTTTSTTTPTPQPVEYIYDYVEYDSNNQPINPNPHGSPSSSNSRPN